MKPFNMIFLLALMMGVISFDAVPAGAATLLPDSFDVPQNGDVICAFSGTFSYTGNEVMFDDAYELMPGDQEVFVMTIVLEQSYAQSYETGACKQFVFSLNDWEYEGVGDPEFGWDGPCSDERPCTNYSNVLVAINKKIDPSAEDPISCLTQPEEGDLYSDKFVVNHGGSNIAGGGVAVCSFNG